MSVVLPNQGLSDLQGVVPLRTESPGSSRSGSFGEILGKVNDVLAKADASAAGYAQGKVGLTEAVLAAERADTTFQVLMAVRNRALAAYQEIVSQQI
jgi:flagellar hook-basal body complex protein FliE